MRARGRPRHARPRSPGRRPAPTREHFTSTFTSHPAHASSASASVGSHGKAARISANGCVDQQADRFDRGVVMDDQDAVGGAAHVQLDPVGTQFPRPHEGVDGVLPGQAVGAPMGQYERSRRHAVQVTSIQKTQRVPLLTVNVLVRTLARWCTRPLPCRFSLRGSGQRRPDTHVSGRTRPASVRPIRRGN